MEAATALAPWQSLVIAIWVGLIQSRVTMMSLQLRYAPLMTALVIGLVMGNVPTALTIGVAVQLALFNVGGAGSSTSAEPSVAAAIAVPVAMMSNLDPGSAAAIAVPVGILGSYLYQFRFFINSYIMNWTEKHAENANESGLTRTIIWLPLLTSMVMFIVVIFIALQYGAPVIASFTETYVQGRVAHVLSTIGGGLAVTGLAGGMVAIGREDFMPFFIIAYFLTYALPEVNTLTWAIIGAMFAIIFVMGRDDEKLKAND